MERAFKSPRSRGITSILIITMVAVIAMAITIEGSAFAKLTAKRQEPTCDSTPMDNRELKIGSPIERELSGNGIHSYRLSLNRGQYLKVVVEQKGIDLIVKLFDPDLQKVSEVDSPNGTLGPEVLATIAETAGEYRLEVRPLDAKARAGRYEIELKELRESTKIDRDRTAAELVISQAELFRLQGTAESLAKAKDKYNEALTLLRALGDREREAFLLAGIGLVQTLLSENTKALESYGQALMLYRSIGNSRDEARMLNNIGAVQMRLGETQKALESYQQALPLTRVAKDRMEEANSLLYLGRVYIRLGQAQRALEYLNQGLTLMIEADDGQGEAMTRIGIGNAYLALSEFQKSLEHLNRALEIVHLLSNRRTEGMVLNNIGFTYYRSGNLQKALAYFDQSLPFLVAAGDRFLESDTLDNVGKVFDRMGEPQKALQYYEKALAIRRTVADRAGQGVTLHNIGMIYMNLGEMPRALEYFEQALILKRQVGNRTEQAYTLDSIGSVYSGLGDFRKALQYYHQSLILRHAVKDRYGEAYSLTNIGTVYDQLGELQKALQYFDETLILRRTVEDRIGEADTLHHIGSTYRKLGESDKSLEYLKQALALSRSVKYQSREAAILLDIARTERDLGNVSDSRKQIESALSLIESTRAKINSQQVRTSYFALSQVYYKFYIDLLMQMHQDQPNAGFDATALLASERARARSLLELLIESRADIRQGVDLTLLERERASHEQLNAKLEGMTRLLSAKHTEEQETVVRKEVEALLTDIQGIEAQIRIQSPRYAALTQPSPLSLNEIQPLLDQDTVLLEYALGEERSYAWAVTPHSIKSFELPKRAVIEAEARHVYDVLVSKSDRLDPACLNHLSRILLGPVADQLGRKRLLVVGEGALQYVPFGALPAPSVYQRPSPKGKQKTADKYQPLILDHEVVSLPSASVVGVLRREVAMRPPAPKKLAVLADPVFVKEDGRVKSRVEGKLPAGVEGAEKEAAAGSLPSNLKRSADDSGLTGFARLTVSRREAELITALDQSGQSLMALDFAASRATAMSHELSRYQILHFATHSLLNNRHPELSGIVLSLVNERGEPQDGFVRLHDIYNLKLDADLVVLSACETALGKDINGEGVVGLARGFMYAGAPRVVASLWKVTDSATAELMQRFYQNMLNGKMRPAAALRAAQVSMWKERQWAAPYYWAGFVIQGEWR